MSLMYIRQLVQVCVVWTLALFWASVVVGSMLIRLLLKPWRPFWFVKKRDTPPATLLDPQWGQRKFIRLKDIKIHYVEKGDSSKPLMLFVHGFPEFWFSWRHQLKEFSKDYWTVALDMRGYGDSDKPSNVNSYQINYLVDDIKEFVKALGREKFILVAHDWGGVVAWQFLFNFPEMVEKYVIMDAPYPRGFRKHVFKSMRQFLMSWYIFFFQVPYLPEIVLRSNDLAGLNRSFRNHRSKNESKVTDDDLEAFKYTFGKPGAYTGPINYYRANFGTSSKMVSGSDKKLPPGLFISGEKDDYLSQELLAKVKIYVQDCTMEVINGANHFVQQDDPESVNASMRKFLQS